MEYDLFRNKVQQVKAKKPILFTLETDTPPSIDKIEDFEKIYRMVLPEKYKLFIIEFGEDILDMPIYIRWTIVAIIS